MGLLSRETLCIIIVMKERAKIRNDNFARIFRFISNFILFLWIFIGVHGARSDHVLQTHRCVCVLLANTCGYEIQLDLVHWCEQMRKNTSVTCTSTRIRMKLNNEVTSQQRALVGKEREKISLGICSKSWLFFFVRSAAAVGAFSAVESMKCVAIHRSSISATERWMFCCWFLAFAAAVDVFAIVFVFFRLTLYSWFVQNDYVSA